MIYFLVLSITNPERMPYLTSDHDHLIQSVEKEKEKKNHSMFDCFVISICKSKKEKDYTAYKIPNLIPLVLGRIFVTNFWVQLEDFIGKGLWRSED